MLVLKRNWKDRIEIHHGGETLVVQVVETDEHFVRLGFDGPTSFHVIRDNAKDRGPRHCDAEVDEHRQQALRRQA